MCSPFIKEVRYLNWLCFLLSFCCIVLMLVRHALLERGKLAPNNFSLCDCTAALFGVSAVAQKPETRMRRVTATANDTNVHLKVILFGTYLCLFCYLIFCLLVAVSYMSSSILGLLPFGFCFFAVPIADVFFIAAKVILYAILVARLQVGFEGSAFAYSKLLIRGLYAYVVIFWLIYNAMAVALVRGQSDEVNCGNDTVNVCSHTSPVFYIAFGVFSDSGFTLSLMFLFTSALKKLARNMDTSDDRKFHAELCLLPLKYSVLCSVAVLSTMATLIIFGIVRAAHFLVAIDCVVNCASLVLMNAKWDPVYIRCCTPLLKCVAKTPGLPCASAKEVELIELIASGRQKSVSPIGHNIGSVSPKTPISTTQN